MQLFREAAAAAAQPMGRCPMGGGYPPFSAGQGAMAPPQATPGSSYGTRSAGTPSGYGSDGGGPGQGYGSRSSRGAGDRSTTPAQLGCASQPTLCCSRHRYSYGASRRLIRQNLFLGS